MLARTASQMMLLTLVLFVLQRFHSPSLAGITVFLSIAPGVALSPIAGALLDRHGRVRLITLDYLVGFTLSSQASRSNKFPFKSHSAAWYAPPAVLARPTIAPAALMSSAQSLESA